MHACDLDRPFGYLVSTSSPDIGRLGLVKCVVG